MSVLRGMQGGRSSAPSPGAAITETSTDPDGSPLQCAVQQCAWDMPDEDGYEGFCATHHDRVGVHRAGQHVV